MAHDSEHAKARRVRRLSPGQVVIDWLTVTAAIVEIIDKVVNILSHGM
ncbi:hypothetical protein ABT009_41985 [Streptomyces sp. NPDC002896]